MSESALARLLPQDEGRRLSQEDGRLVPLDERRLLPRYARGEQRAFGELLRQFKSPVYGYLVRCGVAVDVRDDLFQEIFCRIHASASSYRPEKALKPWIFTIVANVVRTHYRKQRIQTLIFPEQKQGVAGEVSGLRESRDARPSSQEILESREIQQWLESSLSRLPFLQRQVFVLTRIEGLSLEEVGEILELPTGTVKTHLHRARLNLSAGLARRNLQVKREVSE